jgi:ABC-type glycerol-3-phosphate transport system permease component
MTKKKTSNVIIFCILCLLVVAFLTPIFFVLINSFKGKLFISNNPFALPTAETFVGLTNYVLKKPVFSQLLVGLHLSLYFPWQRSFCSLP